MTVTIKQETVNGNYIYIEQDKFSVSYKVGISKDYGNGTCGYPYSELNYETLPKAKKRYSYLKRKILKGEY